jgi:hypothetical protein
MTHQTEALQDLHPSLALEGFFNPLQQEENNT